jgi:D-alanyl-D-alanine carboxypeptidase
LQILGGKTGYNDAARYCLVIAVAIDGRNYGMALLGTEGKLARFGDVARVVDWIVTHKAKLTAPVTVQGPPLPDGFSGIPEPATMPKRQNPDGAPAASSQPDR